MGCPHARVGRHALDAVLGLVRRQLSAQDVCRDEGLKNRSRELQTLGSSLRKAHGRENRHNRMLNSNQHVELTGHRVTKGKMKS